MLNCSVQFSKLFPSLIINSFYNFYFTYHMSFLSFNRFDSPYYSRPVSYRSYNPRITKKEVLNIADPETEQVLDFFRRNNVVVDNLGGLSRGVRFGDLEVGRRVFNHNSGMYYANSDYFIHQWKDTNDLSKNHPKGTHYVTKSFEQLLNKLQQVLEDQRKKY